MYEETRCVYGRPMRRYRFPAEKAAWPFSTMALAPVPYRPTANPTRLWSLQGEGRPGLCPLPVWSIKQATGNAGYIRRCAISMRSPGYAAAVGLLALDNVIIRRSQVIAVIFGAVHFRRRPIPLGIVSGISTSLMFPQHHARDFNLFSNLLFTSRRSAIVDDFLAVHRLCRLLAPIVCRCARADLCTSLC